MTMEHKAGVCARKERCVWRTETGLTWRGSSLEGVLFPHCAPGAERS